MSGRILVVDDVAVNRALIRAKLTSVYYDVMVTGDAEEVLDIIRTAPPALILLDVMMPEIDAFDLCEQIKSTPDCAHIPIVMMSAIDDPDDRVRGLAAGADDFLIKPMHDVALFARVRNLMRMRFAMDELQQRNETARELGLPVDDLQRQPQIGAGQAVTIAAPDDRRGALGCVELVERLGVSASFTTTEADAQHIAHHRRPDAFVIYQGLADNGDGLRLVASLARSTATRHIAIVFVVEDDNMCTAAKALDLGAWDYIMAPADPNELSMRLRSQLRRRVYSMRLRDNVTDGLRLASIDPLTGLYNRRYCSFRLNQIVKTAGETGAMTHVMALDLDHFKLINDAHGHDAGDVLLQSVSQLLKENVRGVDLTVRTGGEEFVLVLPETTLEEARTVAERVRSAIAEADFQLSGHARVRCTISIGLAAGIGAERTASELLTLADENLYLAKARGRNCIVAGPAEVVKFRRA